MRELQQISVQISAVAGRPGEYLARFSSQFYGATYAPMPCTFPTRSSAPLR